MTNLIDRTVAFFSPQAAVKRAHARRVLSYYEAAKPDRLRKGRRETGSGDTAVGRAGTALREQARHLEQNQDVARNALGILVANTVGPHGIQVEPQPRNLDGEIHDDFAWDILELYRNWCKRPEVTWQHNWASAQRLLARSWFRDGEVFQQLLGGPVATLNHGTRVPFSVELIEADFVPLGHYGSNIVQGVERNSWGRPVAYHVYKSHPADAYRFSSASDLKRVAAERILHVKCIDRIGQARGVSVFASVLGRLDDIKDYEESERVAAKVAASMAAFIKKGAPDQYEPDTSENPDGQRDLKFRAGMIFDDLLPGEEIGMIDSNRPNPNLDAYLNGQLRRAAGGIGTSYSSLSKNYDGTYSAQRQELVEQWGAYQILAAEFTGAIVQPTFEQFLQVAIATGVLQVPDDVDRNTLDDALYIAPQMPWIDPLKEANAWVVLETNGYASGPEIIRRRGMNPNDVLEQETSWRKKARANGLTFEPFVAVEPAAPEPGARYAKTRRA